MGVSLNDTIHISPDRATYVRLTYKATLFPGGEAERYRLTCEQFLQGLAPAMLLVGNVKLPVEADKMLGVGNIYIDATLRVPRSNDGQRWGDVLDGFKTIPVSWGDDLERSSFDVSEAAPGAPPRTAVTRVGASSGNAYDTASHDESLSEQLKDALAHAEAIGAVVAVVLILGFGSYLVFQGSNALKVVSAKLKG